MKETQEQGHDCLSDLPLTIEAAIDHKGQGYVKQSWHDWEMVMPSGQARERAKLISVLSVLASQESAFFRHYKGNSHDIEKACQALRSEVLPDPIPGDLKLIRAENDWCTYVALEINNFVTIKLSSVEAYTLASTLIRCSEFADLMAFITKFLAVDQDWDERLISTFMHDYVLAKYRWDLEQSHKESEESRKFDPHTLLTISKESVLTWESQVAEEDNKLTAQQLKVIVEDNIKRVLSNAGKENIEVKAVAYEPTYYERLVLIIRGCQLLIESLPSEQKNPIAEPTKRMIGILANWKPESLMEFCKELLSFNLR
jgi:hypothetical protein